MAGPLFPDAREFAPGLRRWTALHPEWKAEVGCVALDRGGELVLVDPLLPAEPEVGLTWEALDLSVELGSSLAVVLTVFWHERSACEIVAPDAEASLWAPADAVDRIGCAVTNPFRPGDRLPGGLEALATARAGEVVLWDPASASLIPGDVILGAEGGGLELCPGSWLPEDVGREGLARSLAPLLDLPVERVLVSHGEPVLEAARAPLAAAIEPFL